MVAGLNFQGAPIREKRRLASKFPMSIGSRVRFHRVGQIVACRVRILESAYPSRLGVAYMVARATPLSLASLTAYRCLVSVRLAPRAEETPATLNSY